MTACSTVVSFRTDKSFSRRLQKDRRDDRQRQLRTFLAQVSEIAIEYIRASDYIAGSLVADSRMQPNQSKTILFLQFFQKTHDFALSGHRKTGRRIDRF